MKKFGPVLGMLSLINGVCVGVAQQAAYHFIDMHRAARSLKKDALSLGELVRVGEMALRLTRNDLARKLPLSTVEVPWIDWVLQLEEEPTVVEQMQEEMKGGMLDFCFELYDGVASDYYDAIQGDDTDLCIALAKQARLQALVVVEEAKALGRTNLQQSWERLVSDWDRKIDGLESINDKPEEEVEAKPAPFFPAGYGTLTSGELERMTQQENVFSSEWKPDTVDRHLLSDMPYHVALIEHEGENMVNGRFLGRWDVTAWVVDVVDPDPKSLDLLTDMEMTIFDEEGRQVSSWDIPAEKAGLFDQFQQMMAEVLFS